MWWEVLVCTVSGVHRCWQLVPRRRPRRLVDSVCCRMPHQCAGTLLGAVTQVPARTSLWKTWLVCVSTFAKADSLTDLRKGVRLRNYMNESFTGAKLFVRLSYSWISAGK